MRRVMISFAAVSVCIFLCPQPKCDESSPSINFKIRVEPVASASSATLSRDFDEQDLAKSFPATVSVPISSPIKSRADVSMIWNDGTSSHFPINLSALFANKSVEIFFFKDASDPTKQNNCVPSEPKSNRQIFEMYFYCKSATIYLEEKGNKWTTAHRRAMNGWLIANYALYTKGNSISPYAFDTDLSNRMKEMIYLIDIAHRFQPNSFNPLRADEVRDALRVLEQEDVRLAGLVPNAIKAGNLDSASELNSIATKKFEELKKTTGAVNVQGVTGDLLKSNASFINTLKGRT